MNEGYIKFNCHWKQQEIEVPEQLFRSMQKERSRLYALGLIGMYPDGIGFGNISVRINDGQFLITGSSTGQFLKLNRTHFALVDGYSFAGNSISCIGLTKASAESLTHAAVYEVSSETGAVVHIHCRWLWDKLLNILPTTSPEIEYGTPEMADTVKKLVAETSSHFEKIIIMGGHQEGILAFANSLEEATSTIINIYNRYRND
jgi:ribulose-5-phosphate 4-epimerase/fuculose-1-phosphate aldolase